jgi:dihydroxyacetone kinase-like protein
MEISIMLSPEQTSALIDRLATVIAAHAEELTSLDSAIGDGDHGINMKRGFEALRTEREAIAAKPPAEALKAAGMKLVMTVGGASGPLYGTLLMSLGKELGPEPAAAELAAAFRKAVDAVAQRGKSEAGQKTMLDVLYPVADALIAGASLTEAARIAGDRAEATVPMLATRGRASFLGERSIGHMDPGARSTALILSTIADFMETSR